MNINFELPSPLTSEYQNVLFKNYNLNKDSNIRKILIEHNLRLVIMRIKTRFSSLNFDKEDLFMIGTIGLIQAIDNYDINKGISFSTFATGCIDNQILAFKRVFYRHNVEEEKSLNEKVSYTDKMEIIDTISSNTDFEASVINNVLLSESLKCLDEKEKDILLSYYGALGRKKLNQRELAEKYSVTYSRIQQILRISIEKIIKSNKNNINISIFYIFKDYERERVKKSLRHLTKEELYRLRDIRITELNANGKEKDLYLKIKSYL